MSFVSRLRNGVTLTGCSFRVLLGHPKLLVFPFVSGLATIGFFLALLGPMFLFDGFDGLLELGDVGIYLALFGVYFGTTFISTFFNAALVHAAGRVFAGHHPSIRGSLRATLGNVGIIVVWALLAATVSLLVRAIEERVPFGGTIIAAIFSVGWSILTFFVVPVMVYEDVGVRGLLGRSGQTFKRTWGETMVGGFGVSIVMTLVTFVLFVGAVAASFALSLGIVAIVPIPGVPGTFGLTVVLGGSVLILGHLAYVTVWGILKTALYGYAKTGEVPEAFDAVDFDAVVTGN